ncbi:MAG: hypothetical protein VXX85_00920 [Candidatus Margulisiibacteriota bacterium]|nr:hypothetical protein [Candidatus Margulisiibacteriota bacterium]
MTRSIIGLYNQINYNDYEPVIKTGQALLSQFKIPSLYSNYSRYLDDLNIKTHVFSLEFPSPVTFAAFEAHFDSLLFWLNLGCGGGCLKTIKCHTESGNPNPRIHQIKLNKEPHLINALGLPGKGANGLISDIKNSKLTAVNRPLGLSIGGHSLAEYKQTIDIILNQPIPLKQPYFEINISCPNTTTGKSMHDNLAEIENLITHIRKKTAHVIVIKVSPDASNQNLCDIADLCSGYKDVTINAGNTTFKKAEEVGLNSNQMSIGGGGVSGPILFDRTLEIAKLLKPFNLPLISTGGISSIEQVTALKNEGAVIFGMATAIVQNPFNIVRLNKALNELV